MTKRFDKFSPVVEQRTEPKTFTNAILVVEEPIAQPVPAIESDDGFEEMDPSEQTERDPNIYG